MLLLPDRPLASETRRLAARQLWTVRARGPLLVQSVNGTLWVTAGREDVVLETGQSGVFEGPYPVVVQALSDAELTVRAAPARSSTLESFSCK